MPLSDIVTVNITATTASPTQQGFGVPLIAAYTTVFSGRVQTYSQLSDMTTAGFLVTDPAYLCASKVWSQNPRVPLIKVGRRALEFTQSFKLTALDATAGDVYAFSIGNKTYSYTVLSSATTTTVATALAALINGTAPTGLASCTSSGAVVTVTANAGVLLDFLQDTQNHLGFLDNTADPGIATDLAAIYNADSAFYGLLLDSQGDAEIAAAAAWTESNQVLFGWNTSDTECANSSSTTDIMYTQKAHTYAQSYAVYSFSQLLSYSAAALMGNRFTSNPGSDTWSFKTLAGPVVDVLTPSQIHAVENKNGNVYTTVAGLNITQFGKCTGGQYIDVTRFVGWLQATLQTAVFGLLSNNSKIPFTDAGIDAVRSTILGVLKQGIDFGGIAETPKPVVSLPLAANVSALNKSARNLPNIQFTATLAGAIHSTVINGTLSL